MESTVGKFVKIYPSQLLTGISYPWVSQPFQGVVYHDQAVPLWVVEANTDAPDRSVFFMSTDGKHFHELIEVGKREGESRRLRWFGEREIPDRDRFPLRRRFFEIFYPDFDPLEIRNYRLERGSDVARLFRGAVAGEGLVSGAMGRIDTKAAHELLVDGAFVAYKPHKLYDFCLVDFLSAYLAYHSLGRWLDAWYSRKNHVAEVIRVAATDERRFAALCLFAEECYEEVEWVLLNYDNERIALAARHYEGVMRVLQTRAKDGDREALEALRVLAFESDTAIGLLLMLQRVNKVTGAIEALRTISLDDRYLLPSRLKALDDIGHPDAERMLRQYEPAKYKGDNNGGRGLSPEELGMLVRHSNQDAFDMLYAFYADGNLEAQKVMRELINERVVSRRVVTQTDLDPLAARAHGDPAAVVALYGFHEDGHRAAFDILQKLKPIDNLLAWASTRLIAVHAIDALDRAGNSGIREGINAVSIEQWREQYHGSGHAKLDAKDAREAMAILASLGNEEARDFDGHARAMLAARGFRTILTVKVLGLGELVEIATSSPSSLESESNEEEKT